jgi:hypothetical protein
MAERCQESTGSATGKPREAGGDGCHGGRLVRAHPEVIRTRPAPLFEFEALEQLPCGCVTASYRSRQWDVSLVSVEARGPHCMLKGHGQGQIVQLGDPFGLHLRGSPEEPTCHLRVRVVGTAGRSW